MMDKNVCKTLAIVCLGMAVLTSVPAVSSAATADEGFTKKQEAIAPLYLCIVDWDNSLSISGTTATVDCWVKGRLGAATKAKVIAELQVQSGNSWIPVQIWTDTKNSYKAEVYQTRAITPGNAYRVKATMTVWEGSQSETTTVYDYM